MLQIRMLSGEAVTSIPVKNKIRDVRGVKQHLNRRHGLPPRFRQRVLLRDEIVDDSVILDSSVDLYVVSSLLLNNMLLVRWVGKH